MCEGQKNQEKHPLTICKEWKYWARLIHDNGSSCFQLMAEVVLYCQDSFFLFNHWQTVCKSCISVQNCSFDYKADSSPAALASAAVTHRCVRAHFQTPSPRQQQVWMGQSHSELLCRGSYWISRNRLRMSHGTSITLKAHAVRSNTAWSIESHRVEGVFQPSVFPEGSSQLKSGEAEFFYTLLLSHTPDYFTKPSSGEDFP